MKKILISLFVLISVILVSQTISDEEKNILIKKLKENSPWIMDDSTIDVTVKIEYKITDNTDKPFINDKEIIGKWKSVDFIKDIETFDPNKKSWGGELYFNEINFQENGKTNKDWWIWTKGYLIHLGDKTASECVIKKIKNTKYLFIQWKSGDYIFRGMKPFYYVFKKVK